MPVNKGEILLPIARSAISQTLPPHEAAEDTALLQEKAACFVTLMQKGELRGCIGSQ